MLASDSNSTQQVRWRYSWGSVTRELSEWEGNTTPVIEKVNTSDAGVYEAYTTSSTDSGYVRLIVRGCRYNLWGSPSCQWTCPVCYNGGICDDVSGGCVCPPGFTGGQCEQACPSGYIGRRCGISCATVIGVADCRGVEICLPHPFGCSCAPGFTGLDCQTVCDQGAYGAGCTEVCHCQSMSQCDSKTGLCSESGCERSWKGPMCQAKIFDVVGYGRPAAFQIGASFTVEGLTTLDMDTSVKLLIGRELDTGTGKTGSGMSHENANLTTMPSTSGLPAGTLQFTANGGHNSRLTLETMSSNYSHLGVYYRVRLVSGGFIVTLLVQSAITKVSVTRRPDSVYVNQVTMEMIARRIRVPSQISGSTVLCANCRSSFYNAVRGALPRHAMDIMKGLVVNVSKGGFSRFEIFCIHVIISGLVNSQACRDGYYGSLCTTSVTVLIALTCQQNDGSWRCDMARTSLPKRFRLMLVFAINRYSIAIYNNDDIMVSFFFFKALPALSDAPSVTVVEEGIQVSWNLWRPGYDYGTGPVDSYRVNFGLTNISTEQQREPRGHHQ
ncbi:putative fibropellin-1-like [Apostichopus japonicus]|uniref:Putative fibropellin-1-like n=1 Tax=Stichopus japonicus TaxID=307972 RepID=A0A2G8KK79_STIJA|nr:putative fibropellin-1-like [Apostichopus japonicus]